MEKIKLKDLVMAGKISRGFLGKASSQEEGVHMPIIGIKDLVDGRIDTRYLEKREIPIGHGLPRSVTCKEDILFAAKGPSFNSALVDANSKGHIFSSNIIQFRVNEKILPDIIVAYLNSPEGKVEIDSFARGASLPSISVNKLLELEIPVPPLNTQIALKEYINSLDRYLEALHEEEELIKKIKNHVLSSIFGGTA